MVEGGSQKGPISWAVMGGLEWQARSWGTLPKATKGYQSLNKYSLAVVEVQGLQENKTVPFLQS